MARKLQIGGGGKSLEYLYVKKRRIAIILNNSFITSRFYSCKPQSNHKRKLMLETQMSARTQSKFVLQKITIS